jgi:hypothetical protein
MDNLSSMPIPVLDKLHGLVLEAGGLSSALALEATCKELRSVLHANTRFRGEVAVEEPDPGFGRWIKHHGHRVDHLHLIQWHLANDDLGLLHYVDGISQAGQVAITVDEAWSLEPLASLPNITHVYCDVLVGTKGMRKTTISLSPLRALPRLESLSLCSMDDGISEFTSYDVGSLEPVSSLVALTHLELASMYSTSSLCPLTSLGASLASAKLSHFPSVQTLGPIASLTSLTSLVLRDFTSLRGGLEALSSLGRLLDLELAGLFSSDSSLSLQPLGGLPSLHSLIIDCCDGLGTICLQPLSNLKATLRTLRVIDTGLNAAGFTAGGPISALTALTALELNKCLPSACCQLGFLTPLTNMVKLSIADGRSVTSLEPLSTLGSLTELSLKAFNHVTTLEPLRGLSTLQIIRLDSCHWIDDLMEGVDYQFAPCMMFSPQLGECVTLRRKKQRTAAKR